MKKSIAVLLIVVMVMGLVAMTGCSAPAASEEKEFRVGMECNYAPFNWTQSDDSNNAVEISAGGYAGGYDVEIAKKIADGLGK